MEILSQIRQTQNILDEITSIICKAQVKSNSLYGHNGKRCLLPREVVCFRASLCTNDLERKRSKRNFPSIWGYTSKIPHLRSTKNAAPFYFIVQGLTSCSLPFRAVEYHAFFCSSNYRLLSSSFSLVCRLQLPYLLFYTRKTVIFRPNIDHDESHHIFCPSSIQAESFLFITLTGARSAWSLSIGTQPNFGRFAKYSELCIVENWTCYSHPGSPFATSVLNGLILRGASAVSPSGHWHSVTSGRFFRSRTISGNRIIVGSLLLSNQIAHIAARYIRLWVLVTTGSSASNIGWKTW